MKIKKHISFLLLCLLLISSLFVNPAYAQVSIDIGNDIQKLEGIKIEDIDNYPDVKEIIEEKGFQHLLETGTKKDEFLYKHLNLAQSESTSRFENLDQDRLSEIAKKLGLQMPGKPEVLIEEFFLVKYKETDSISIQNIWYLTYSADDYGFKINLVNIGFDKIDSITGNLTMYKNNGRNWDFGGSKAISKFQVGNGTVDTWQFSKTNVSDYFEYNLTVTEDGQTWVYSNKNNDNKYLYQRYNFAVGPYSSITASGGERHHFVSKDSLTAFGFNSNTAPSIRMLAEDHAKTPNWGSSTAAANFRAKEQDLLRQRKYEDLISLEVEAFKNISDPEGKYSNLAAKYNDYLVLCAYYYYGYFGI